MLVLDLCHAGSGSVLPVSGVPDRCEGSSLDEERASEVVARGGGGTLSNTRGFCR
jgi:hypothetical protein